MEIQMGTRDTKVDTGTLSKPKTEETSLESGIKINKSTIGMENLVHVPKPEKKEILQRIEIDQIKTTKLIEIAVKDLSTKRLMSFGGSTKEIVFIKEYDEKSKAIKFNYDITAINNMLKTKEDDLSNFFLSFLFSNIRKYIKNEWNALPENLPIISVDEAGIKIPNTIILTIR